MRLSRALLTNVRHNLKTKPIIVGTNELTIELDSSTVATVSFVKLDHQTYDLVHTLIPEQLQGQGLGHIFAQRIFDHLLEKNVRLKLSCEFLQHFYFKNSPKYRGFVIEDFEAE